LDRGFGRIFSASHNLRPGPVLTDVTRAATAAMQMHSQRAEPISPAARFDRMQTNAFSEPAWFLRLT
jgi:hypothetical protein